MTNEMVKETTTKRDKLPFSAALLLSDVVSLGYSEEHPMMIAGAIFSIDHNTFLHPTTCQSTEGYAHVTH